MKYRIKKETKPKLPTYGKYKAVAVHNQIYDTYKITEEVAQAMGCSSGDVYGIMLSLSTVINRHLRNGDKVKLEGWGTMKLEIESDKVDNLKDFQAKKHIRGARLHFIPRTLQRPRVRERQILPRKIIRERKRLKIRFWVLAWGCR